MEGRRGRQLGGLRHTKNLTTVSHTRRFESCSDAMNRVLAGSAILGFREALMQMSYGWCVSYQVTIDNVQAEIKCAMMISW